MARYVTRVATPWPVQQAFAYMSDLRNFAQWDPGVRKVVQTEGEAGGPGSVFDVTVASGPRDLTLTYRTVEYDEPVGLLVVARSRTLTSEDRVTITPDGDGCIVTYDAELRLRGVLAVADIGLRSAFRKIGDRAAAGLRAALEGTEA